MPKPTRPKDSEFQAALDDYMRLVTKRNGSVARSHPVMDVAKRFCAFLPPDSAPLALQKLLEAKTPDVDRFVETFEPWLRTPRRRNLWLLFDFLIQTGRASLNIVEEARYWPTARKPAPPKTTMSEHRWSAIVDLFANYTYNTEPWGAAGNVVFLTLSRNLKLTAAEVCRVTAGMARSGTIRLELSG